MTLNELIQAATRLSYTLSGGDVPILVNGKEAAISLFLVDSNTPMVEMDIYFRTKETPQGWISVKDRLPEKGGFYITCVERNKEPKHICADDYFDEKEKEWLYKNKSIAEVDYWMPIPKFKEE